ncbi:hypothetical protein EDD85DRAFT_952538 [Armillaria nabsnona]|nr:hypothetical protein EDD85DRAFT_952538 [Armillaria nabsnona]
MAIPVLSTFRELAISYTLSCPLAFQMVTSILYPSLIAYVSPQPHPYPSLYPTDSVAAFESTTHVWVAHPSSPSLERTVIAKFYDPIYLHDEYESVRSVPDEVKAYEILQSLQGICVMIPRCLGLYVTVIREQDGRTVYVLLLELVAGYKLRYLSEDVEREAIVTGYIYHALPDDDRLDRPWCPGRFGPKEHSSDP